MIFLLTILRIGIIFCLLVVLYSPKSRLVEEVIETKLGTVSRKILFCSLFSLLIVTIFQLFGIEFTSFLKLIKYSAQLLILSIVVLFFKNWHY